MHFSILAIATSIAVVAAQDLSQIPTCAIPCFATAVQGSGCSLTDTKCQCTTGRQSITDSVAKCAPSRCSAADIAAVAGVVVKLCGAAGVTITDLPSVSPSAASSGSPTSAVSGSASGSQSRAATAASASATSTGGVAANAFSLGAIAIGMAAFAL